MNYPFASRNLGKASCFGGFGLSGWILTNRPIFGFLSGLRLVGFGVVELARYDCPLLQSLVY